jgi:hypothetical protein
MIRPESRLAPRTRAPLLYALLCAFVLRVTGQVLVVTRHPAWLPPMEQWHSGLLPYPLLLPAQLVLIAVMLSLVAQVERAGGRLPSSAARVGWLTGASYLYAVAMIVRYVAQVTIHPEWRWFGHTIPVVFHLVLASFLFVLAGAWRDAPTGCSSPMSRAAWWKQFMFR